METKHTPGPWEVSWFKGSPPIAVGVSKEIAPGYSQRLCDSILPDTDEDYLTEKGELEANMKLMAAAPELLEALQNLLKWKEGTINHPRALMDAEAAIKKATS